MTRTKEEPTKKEVEAFVEKYIEKQYLIGESFYPSEIAEALEIDYDMVVETIESLRTAGKLGFKQLEKV